MTRTTQKTFCSATEQTSMAPLQDRVLACVDQSRYAEDVTDYASWAARRLDAPLELLHVIDRHPETATLHDHSGAIGIDAQAHLLDELSLEDEAKSRAAREKGRLFLNGLRARAQAAGVEAPDIRQRYGTLKETLIEQEANVHLFVLGRRGASAEHTRRDLGRNVEGVVRSLSRPILTVTERFEAPERVLIAFDGKAVTRRGVAMVAGSPLFRGLPVHVLMSGRIRADASRQLQWATETLEAAGLTAHAFAIPGDPERVIARCVRDKGIGLLVMGAYGHSQIRNLFVGSRTSDLLRAADVPTLLLR